MTRKLAFMFAVAGLTICRSLTVAQAQNAGGGTTTTTPPATTPPSTNTQQAAPSTGQPATPPAGQATGQDGQKLPEVQVIQEQPKAPPVVKKVVVPKKKPAPVAAQPIVATPPAAPTEATTAATNQVKMSPVSGSEIPKEKVPGSVSTVTASEIASSGSVVPQDYLAQHIPGITVSDIQGNGFQTDIQYRGFEASPVNGVAQGIAVYQNGVRINEAFGDVINLDFLPEMAIQSATVISGNPVFGLNALGGALVFDMKNGFNYQGVEFDFRAGSFGRIQESGQGGVLSKNGNVAAYIAVEHIDDGGWREFSPTQINRTFADLGFKGTGSEFHLNFSGADNSYGVTAAAPEELLAASYSRAFTSPQTTDNRMAMVSLNGSVVVAPKLTVSGVGYYRRFTQKHFDGNIAEFEACTFDATILCALDDMGMEVPLQSGGANVPSPADPNAALGSIDSTSQKADSFGLSVQAVDKSALFGFHNQFLIGASYDHGHVAYTASSTPGVFQPHFVVDSTGYSPLDGPDDFTPRNIFTTNDYYGVYFTNTIDLTSKLAVTLGGRYNFASIKLEDINDPTNPDLNTTNTYDRFNPAAGATYKLAPGLSLYGGYSEANRAPTAAELACADPDNPCLIESFLTSDPPLKQIVSHTWELGLRGDYGVPRDHFEWSAGLFRALNSNDIVTQIANDGTRGFFINATNTLRQGLEASAAYTTDRYRVYAGYNFISATYQDPYEQFSPNNPNAGACNDPAIVDPVCIQVQRGDTLPGVPRHKFKAGFDYWLTEKWKFGADLFASAGQFLYGDENNSNPKLAGYAKVNLHTSYDVTNNIQVYGLIDNLFDARFGTYGTFFDTAEASEASLGEFNFTNPRTTTPSQPFAAYGGIKVKF